MRPTPDAPPPGAPPEPGVPRPAVLAILPALIPSTLISVVKPLRGLHLAGAIEARITLEPLATGSDVAWEDAVVFCRNREPRYRALQEQLVATGTPYVYDLDDDLLDLPADVESGESPAERAARREQMLRYLADARLVRVYSPALAARLTGLAPAVEMVAASLDWSLVPEAPPARDPKRVRIVYVTSRFQDRLAQAFLPAVDRLMERRPGTVEFTFWGSCPPPLPRRPGVRTRRLDPDYDRFLSRLARDGFDVGLAPLPDDAFHRCKTNNKFREYGACRIAGIYSDVEVYASCVRHGETGLLVPADAGAWLAALERLVDDADLRSRIQEAARQSVRADHSQTETESVWLRQIRQAVEGRPRRGPQPAQPVGAQPPRRGAIARMVRFGRDLPARAVRLLLRAHRQGWERTLVELSLHAHARNALRRLRSELGQSG